MDELTNFLAQHPHIHHAAPSSPEYDILRPGYVLDNAKVPAMIIRPRSGDDVAALVAVLKANELPFSVRVGGHDMFGRSQVHDAITIDLREIAYVHVNPEAHTARLGGGVLVMEVLKELKKHGMIVPHPVIPGVGFVGWATHGGYGLLSAQYGFGVDQILQARLVDSQAIIRDADADMLTAIRGGGGCLGIIVELTIKVYPLCQVQIKSSSAVGFVLNGPPGTRRCHHVWIQ
jgi:FAD/FMN-containing dehydrogenase